MNSLVVLVFIYINSFYLELFKKKLLTRLVFPFFDESMFGSSSSKQRGSSLCCRKPRRTQDSSSSSGPMFSVDKKELKQLHKEAYKVIDKNLDVVALIREISNLKALTHMLFKDYHQHQAPLISLSIQYKLDGLNAPAQDCQFPELLDRSSHKKMSTGEALQVLQQSYAQGQSEDSNQQKSLQSGIDRFCMHSLVNGGGIFLNVLKHASASTDSSTLFIDSPIKPSATKKLHSRILNESRQEQSDKPSFIQQEVDL